MAATIYKGTVSFVHHDKEYITIDYEQNNRPKTINGAVSEKIQLKWKEDKIIKKPHVFRIGDEVQFIIVPTVKKDKLMADCIIYLYNNYFTNMLQKAILDNSFVGYLKEVDGAYFVKETASYIVFPLKISAWERLPNSLVVNEPIFFQLDNFDKPDKVTASLKKHQFIPEYNKLLAMYKNKETIEATIVKKTPFGVQLHLINEKIQVNLKLDLVKNNPLNIGETIPVKISFIGPFKIVVVPI